MVAEHKQGFLRLMAEKLYRERQITDKGYRIEDIRYLGLPEEEWLWIRERVAEMALADTHTTTLQ
jgi:hypothetical protein